MITIAWVISTGSPACGRLMKISPPRSPGKWDCDCSAREEMMLIISKVNSFDLFSRKQKKWRGEKNKTKEEEEDLIGRRARSSVFGRRKRRRKEARRLKKTRPLEACVRAAWGDYPAERRVASDQEVEDLSGAKGTRGLRFQSFHLAPPVSPRKRNRRRRRSF